MTRFPGIPLALHGTQNEKDVKATEALQSAALSSARGSNRIEWMLHVGPTVCLALWVHGSRSSLGSDTKQKCSPPFG